MIRKDKQYRTRDGREVRIYATDGGPTKDRVHGDVHEKGGWGVRSWDKHGCWIEGSFGYHPSDLIEVKPRIKRTVWLNVYDNEVIHGGWRTKEEAQGYHEKNRIACLKLDLDFEEGEGL
jgi:hypothetical protein